MGVSGPALRARRQGPFAPQVEEQTPPQQTAGAAGQATNLADAAVAHGFEDALGLALRPLDGQRARSSLGTAGSATVPREYPVLRRCRLRGLSAVESHP